jgi:hypothetical protein
MAAFYHLKTGPKKCPKMTIPIPDGPVFGGSLYYLQDGKLFVFLKDSRTQLVSRHSGLVAQAGTNTKY